MHKMTPEEYHHFMVDTVRTAKLATVCADGRPHVAPVWFDLDGDSLIFTTWHKSIKGKNLQRDPRVALSVDDEKPPFSFVLVEGIATIESATPEQQLYWATRLGGRYMGKELAESFGKRNAVEGELLIRVKPTKIIAQSGLSE